MKCTDDRIWNEKGETLSNVSAEKEYGIKHEIIIESIRAGKLQYRGGNMHGNSWIRLLRQEVEMLMVEIYGEEYLKEKKIQNELIQIDKDIRKLKRQCASIEKRKNELLSMCNK